MLTLCVSLAARVFGALPVTQAQMFPPTAITMGPGSVSWAQLAIFPVGSLGAAVLFALLQYTDVGLAMRGAAQNRRGAALRGIDPDRTTMLAWAIGGSLPDWQAS